MKQQQQSKTQLKKQNKKKMQKMQRQIEQKQQFDSQQEQSSVYSSQDQDAFLLTQKVQQKLLQTVARLKNKDPSIYLQKQNIFDENDFQEQQIEQNKISKKNKQNKTEKKFTYKDMLSKGIQQSEQQSDSSDKDLPPAMQEKKAINKFKQAINKQKNKLNGNLAEQQNDDQLFVVKGKIKKLKNQIQEKQQDKYQNLSKKMKPQTKKLLKNVWQNPQKMDQTDLFLKDYILNKKWLSKHLTNEDGSKKKVQQIIDQQDQQRSIQMDQYEAKYNFRFQEPEGDKIVQYPRKIQQSLRIMPQTRKEKRKKHQQRKKQEQKKIREQAQKKKQELRSKILSKIQQNQWNQNQNEQENEQSDHFENDWFFCDDCGKAFQQEQINYQCNQCQDYMLCQECNQLIIHKHHLSKGKVSIGNGAPKQSTRQKYLSALQPCKNCRRKLPQGVKHFEYKDRSGNKTLMCEGCYDESGLDIKKKFILVEAKIVKTKNNIQEMLEKDPQKVKQLTNSKQIQEMVDQYIKNEFQDVISGGLKTKFKYLTVKPQSFGLSDQQILFGDDNQLNKYVSVKKLAPYRDSNLRLRNNVFKKKVLSINRSVKHSKQLISSQGGQKRLKKSRIIDKLKHRSQVMKKKRQTKLKILNISNPNREKQLFVPSSRLASYGVTLEKKQDNQNLQKGKQNYKK